MCTSTWKKLLDSYHVRSACYAIGPFFADGVTILKQQIRALNLVFALAETKKIRNELDGTNAAESARDIAVIGGGVAGMTAAVAAAKLGNNVWHFEQRPELCHLQAGCDTRAVAPHIYDWPKPGSESPYAGLPSLNWQAGTAAELARCLVKAYDAVAKEAGNRLRLHLGATTFISGDEVKWDNSLSHGRGGSREFDYIIIATGFGVERGVREQQFASYWRNDSLNQSTPGVTSEKTEQLLVSGTGDGGLIDLLRAKIRGFSQAWILDDLFFEEPELGQLRDRLAAIHDECSNGACSTKSPKSTLFKLFTELATDESTSWQLEVIKSRLKKRLRKDVSAVLNGIDDVFPDALRFGRASLSNAFLVFLLYELEAFTYVPGAIAKIDQNKVTIEYPAPERRGAKAAVIKSTYTVDQVIVRHGAEREKCLLTLGALATSSAVKGFAKRQQSRSRLTSTPQWKPGYWSVSTDDALARGEGPKEFLPPPSQAIASTFASTLSNIVMHEAADSEFRLTVHRLIQLRDKVYFQQVSPYWGTRREGEPARIIDAGVGLVGLVSRSGRPIVLKKTNEQTWLELWQRLHAGPATHVRTPRANITSMLAIPIFAKCRGEKRVSLVVYADSAQLDFFVGGQPADHDVSPILTRLFYGATGFVDSCNILHKNKVLRFASSSFWGMRPNVATDQDMIADFGNRGALFNVAGRIENYDPNSITSNVPLHWDCIYRNVDLLTDDCTRSWYVTMGTGIGGMIG